MQLLSGLVPHQDSSLALFAVHTALYCIILKQLVFLFEPQTSPSDTLACARLPWYRGPGFRGKQWGPVCGCGGHAAFGQSPCFSSVCGGALRLYSPSHSRLARPRVRGQGV